MSPLFIALILLMVCAIVLSTWELSKKRRRFYRFRGWKIPWNGVVASALVISIEETGVYLDREPLIRIQMQVLPQRGGNFVVEIREVIPSVQLNSLRNGSVVKVKYNPANPQQAMLLKAI